MLSNCSSIERQAIGKDVISAFRAALIANMIQHSDPGAKLYTAAGALVTVVNVSSNRVLHTVLHTLMRTEGTARGKADGRRTHVWVPTAKALRVLNGPYMRCLRKIASESRFDAKCSSSDLEVRVKLMQLSVLPPAAPLGLINALNMI